MLVLKKQRYISVCKLPDQVSTVLTSYKYGYDLFDGCYPKEQTNSFTIDGVIQAKEIANIITTDLMGIVDTREKREESKITSTHLKDLADSIQSGKISKTSSKNALYEIVKTGKEVSQIISEFDLGNVSDESELLKIIKEVISEEPQAVEQAKSNPQTINYLVGKVMQKTKGKADPKLTLDLLKKQIG